jgi:hypothetical protein
MNMDSAEIRRVPLKLIIWFWLSDISSLTNLYIYSLIKYLLRLFRKLDIVLPEALILLRARYSRKLTVQ